VFLASLGYKVFLASRIDRNATALSKYGNYVYLDWNHDQSLYEACRNMDIVIHAAGMNARDCSTNPKSATEFNGEKTGILVEQAKKASVQKFIYLSTAHVYNSKLVGVIDENNHLENSHPYSISKINGENTIIKNCTMSDMQSIILRVANAFGSPIEANVNCWMLFVNDLCRQITTNHKIEIRSPSNTVRNFITLSDVCSAIEFVISENLVLADTTEIYNLGDKSKTLKDMATMIRDIYSEYKKIDAPILELTNKSSSPEALEYLSIKLENTGWKPNSDFEGEISELIRFCEVNFTFSYPY
jgi:UDP-glucose 4-epimerase